MPTINLTLPVAGNGITAGLHATNYAALQALLNGDLDDNNLADDAVTAAKILNGAVTASKLTLPGLDFTPTWTSTGVAPAIGNATVVARYIQIGKFVYVRGSIIFGGTSTFGTGAYRFALPVTAAAGFTSIDPVGRLFGFDTSSGSTYFAGEINILTTNTFRGLYMNTLPTGSVTEVGALSPWTWASGDQLHFTFFYEAA